MASRDSKPGHLFLNPGFGFGHGQTCVRFWIFTNEDGEADDRIEENYKENTFMEGIQSCFVTVQTRSLGSEHLIKIP